MSQLTEFAPLSPETSQPSVGFLISKFFKLNKGGSSTGELHAPTSTEVQQSSSSHSNTDRLTVMEHEVSQFPVDISEGRSLPNVLKRISNLLALKSTSLQAYKDTDLKQYWMPDSVSKECYDCGEKFTTFRRRHHCRVCGQIFCSRCCNQEIPGKIVGCTGDLRVCTYCCKVVLSYLQSADMGADLTADLRALQEDLQTKFGSATSPISPSATPGSGSSVVDCQETTAVRRKVSLGYQEDRFALGRAQGAGYLSMEERCRVLQKSASLRAVLDELCQPGVGLLLQTHRYRLRNYHDCFLGSDLVDWLITQHRATTRVQGGALGQALMEAGYLESIADQSFTDGYALYRPLQPLSPQGLPSMQDLTRRGSHEAQEPLWVKQIPQHDTTIAQDSEGEPDDSPSLPSSGSTFYLALNLEDSTVHLTRPKGSEPQPVPAEPSVKDPDCSHLENTHPGISNELLSDALLAQTRQPIPAEGWHNMALLSLDHGDRQAYTILSNAYTQHEHSLLKQLLNTEGLAQSWCDVVLPLVQQIVDMVRPDVRNEADNMDIGQYVQLKKVPGGTRGDSCIVNGVVFTKNVAHRAMASMLSRPRILLLGCSIVYQRIEGRLLSLEPVMMQEREYLRHVVARIANLCPDLVLVHRNVSRLAQELLLGLKVTLVLNVKASVLERVSRCTGADIVTSVDAHIGRPQLGTCHSFYLQTCVSDKGWSKTLMFLEGCTSPHLGCTVLLRGSPSSELAKLKRVVRQLVFTRYSWRLEKSFLMDEGARPPSPPTDTFFEDSTGQPPGEGEGREINKLDCVNALPGGRESDLKSVVGHSCEEQSLHRSMDSEECDVQSMSRPIKCLSDSVTVKSQSGDCPPARSSESKTEAALVASKSLNDDSTPARSGESRGEVTRMASKSLSEEKRTNVESVSDFSDPLHLYLSQDDDVFSAGPQPGQALSVTELPLSNRFRKALDDTILSASPFLKFTVPYLETEAGRNCTLRGFFPSEMFCSAQFGAESSVRSTSQHDTNPGLNTIKLEPQHPFVSAKLTSGADSREVQTMLAHFRACGGRLALTEQCVVRPHTEHQPAVTKQQTWLDVLDPANHQRLSVLFCSFSGESHNTPAFCVNPWVVHMDFYGQNDIPLGSFLERYCFRPSYVCPSETCDTPMLHHVRRFVHDTGCVHIELRQLDKTIQASDSNNILVWSWCSKCRQVSSVVPMCSDTWSLSFAKYLELRFHGNMYSRRGRDNSCSHSLHQDHHQYFGQNNLVVSFKYTSVDLWEVSLPPPLINICYDPRQQANIIEEIKTLALKGFEVYSTILEKLCPVEPEVEGVGSLKTQLGKEQAHFNSCIEEVQLQLTSPTLESKKLQGKLAEKDVQKLMWKIEDSVVQLKRLITEGVASWNTRIQDLLVSRRRDEKLRRSDGSRHLHIHTGSLSLETEPSSQTEEDASSCSEGRESPLSSPAEAGEPAPPSGGELADSDISTEPHSIKAEVCDTTAGGSPRGHVRSHSDVTPTLLPVDDRQTQPVTDKMSVKAILSQLLPSASGATTIQSPLSPREHHLTPTGCLVPVVVYENEPSSIIAYALSSQDYRHSLDEASNKRVLHHDEPSPSPVHKRKSGLPLERESLTESSEVRRSGVLSFLRANATTAGVLDGVQYSMASTVVEPTVQSLDSEELKGSKSQPSLHVEVQFLDGTCNFFCRVYFAEQFACLRQAVVPSGEEGYIRSLARCVQWAARGGKSGSAFCKTKDDRFILKEMSRIEMQIFLDFAPHYLAYIQCCLDTNQPTLLGKIVGVYHVVYRNAASNATLRSKLLVMENLFYDRLVTHKFDLKGSVRNRLVNTSAHHEGEIVLLDENLLKMTCDSPLYILPHSKTVLTQAISNDTEFLASQSVMDYSLLVGLDQARRELVVGIIDYIRTFTWDKKLETMVKSSGILGGQGKSPTVVSPELYRARFIAAMHRYFLPVPDRWAGLGKGLECSLLTFHH